MKSNSFALFGTNKLGLFVIFFLALIISVLSVLAAAPTTPTTLSPANNTYLLNIVTLNCSGSTGGDRYLFYTSVNGSDYYTLTQNSTSTSYIVDKQPWSFLSDYTGSGSITGGTSETSPFSLGSVSGSVSRITPIVFNSDIFYIKLRFPETSGCGFTIDDAAVGVTPDNTIQWYAINVSAYNDGNPHTLKFTSTKFGGPGGCNPSWWFNPNVINWKCSAENDEGISDEVLSYYNNLYFNSCPSGNIALNFTLFDEEDRTDNIEGDWSFNLNLKANDSYSYSSNIEDKYNVTLCLTPSGIPVTVSGMLQYTPTNATKYTYPREYYLNRATITGGSQTDINVYSLEDALATSCQFRVTTDGVSPLAGHLIHLQRWHPGDGLFDLVAMGNTSSSGTYTIYLRQTDAFYKAFVYDGNNILQKTLDTTQIQSCPLNIVVGSGADDTYDDVETWLNFDNIILNLRFNSTTNTTSLTWDDSTGYATRVCLRIDKFATTGMSLYNYTCLTSSSGTIYQNINESGHYIAKAIVFHNSEWRLLDSLVIEIVSTISELLSGNEGVFYAFLLILTITFVGLYSPPISIFLAIIGFIFSKMLGLITVGWGAILGLVITGGILIFKQKGR